MRVRERRAYEDYKNSVMCDLFDAYSTASNAKQNAWRYCKHVCESKNGTNLKVITKNSFAFTAGFEYEEDGKPMFMYITKDSDTAVQIN